MEKIKDIQNKLNKFDEMTRLAQNSIGNDEVKKLEEEIILNILELLDWRFEYEISWDFEKNSRKIFEFLVSKERTTQFIEYPGSQFAVRAPKMDRDFFKKYSKEIFCLMKYNYDFIDETKKIFLDHDGGIQIYYKNDNIHS